MPQKKDESTVLDTVPLRVFVPALLLYALVSATCSCVSQRRVAPEPPPAAWAPEWGLTRPMPMEPFPGQRTATKDGQCGVRQVAIRVSPASKEVGCWKRLAEPPTPKEGCGEDFEWQGACYAPVLKAQRVPTSVEP